ncbi:hypothetical protein OROHE_001329 [Orobanche hederae]
MNVCTTIDRGVKSSPLISATEDEICVAGILLDLPNIIRRNKSRLRFKWGTKRRRSRIDEGASYSPAPSSLQKTEERKSVSKAEAEKESAAGSPVTPLSFTPSESDEEKSRHPFKKSSRTRSREEYMDLIEELTQRRDLLSGEIANVTMHYNKLKADNYELKALQQKVLKSRLKEKRPEMGVSLEMNLGKELMQNHRQHSMATSSGPATAQYYIPYNGLGPLFHGVGPVGIPDLNISAREAFGFDPSQPLGAIRAVDDRRAISAEARRMRKGIIKIKSMRACGIELPVTR